ncbi:Thiol:disulfide interchange protein DsbD [Fundidesulfovibrio magnetotacticus]|uniref:Thiol:disulfide interchange protein DsbD n=1 Tax=Fundidesulfovibrio magnetotacticus TaxID=2730080 RepID=A0A6V8LRH2_9BACT|nr:cytochrome c biogenesis protein CcdA [Fundidesulfovibrio magnetotacticus]GFK92938.1 Thiol:disulfide interchange protein DsbD [Fundidesulfovibrio magnetotacticus]
MRALLQALAMLLALALPSAAQESPVAASWELAALPDGKGLVAVLWLTPAQGYKTYGADPGEAGMPTRAEARLTPTGQALDVLYPPGKSTRDLYEPDKTVSIYDGPTPLFITLPPGLPEGFGVEVRVSLLACTDVSCWPVLLETELSSRQFPAPPAARDRPWWGLYAELAARGPEAAPKPVPDKAPEASSDLRFTPRSLTPHLEVDGLLKALPLALLAGLLLNLMPCVLPVACLKLSGLLASCHASGPGCDRYALIRRHNLWFSAGVLVYFCVLAQVLGAAELAWGQLFQSPGLILGAAVALFALGLSLFGVFYLPVVDLKIAHGHARSPRIQAFTTGMLATLLATPCSGPFLGGVLAWTLLQPPAVVVTVFTGIGAGMALPYLILALRPELTRFVPRPGPWMVQLEKLAGFMLMGACLYFLSILPQALLLPALATLLAAGLACHAWGAWTSPSQGLLTRWGVRLAGVALVVWMCLWALAPTPRDDAGWEPYAPRAFAGMLGKENLLVDFTADWCPTCKALEKTVLVPKALKELRERHGVRAVRVDLTRESPEAMALLRALGSASIPLAALFPKGEGAKSPVVLRDLFTSGQLEQAAKEAFGHAQ